MRATPALTRAPNGVNDAGKKVSRNGVSLATADGRDGSDSAR